MYNPHLTIFCPSANAWPLQNFLLTYTYFGESAVVIMCIHKKVQWFNGHWLFSSYLPHPLHARPAPSTDSCCHFPRWYGLLLGYYVTFPGSELRFVLLPGLLKGYQPTYFLLGTTHYGHFTTLTSNVPCGSTQGSFVK